MAIRILLAGIILGTVLVLAFGAASNQGNYQMALVVCGREGCFVVARLDRVSGEIVMVKRGEFEAFPNPTVCLSAVRQ